MAMSNHERIGKALEALRDGLAPFVARELEAALGKYWVTAATQGWEHDLAWSEDDELPRFDAAALLRLMWDQWNPVFKNTLGFAERSLVSELREVRNKWAHQVAFNTDDAYRALDSAHRLLLAVSAPQADEVEKSKLELLRQRYEEERARDAEWKAKERREANRQAALPIGGQATGAPKPWREVVAPHPDVASGRYQQAEFAADLWQVRQGEGSAEYRDPVEFYRRTFLTDSLKRLLVNAARRLAGQGGDPVIQLQTNFGGGKTHAMLALYHLFSGVAPAELEGVAPALAEAGIEGLPAARRVVLVGTKISVSTPSVKPDGVATRTLWGELAWQLGGREAYERIRADDERATSPGDALRELFVRYSPCLILIDEWVAYARQLHDQSDTAAGSFETQFTFAQTLTESAKLAPQCLLVISLPASDVAQTSSRAARAETDDAEVGGLRGREALDRLRNVIGRVESAWRPASAEEGFEIVRRRLFQPLIGAEQNAQRDLTARAFADLYRSQPTEFPSGCGEADYERRIRAAYPIHPEVFDRLYTDWSTLVRFQRTRGVLRLMAAVIHTLWEQGDPNPLILPSMIPIADPRVEPELTNRYLSDNWAPVIERDVDGPNSLPLRLDNDTPSLGMYTACRRVARTIYLGSAPTSTAANRGIEDRRIKLGCALPGEPPAVYGDALRRLAASATYLYQDGTRYWYATQPTVTKLAEDRAEQLKRERDKVAQEIERRLRADVQRKGDFSRVHPLPGSGADVPDDLDARLVVLSPDHPYNKEQSNAAEEAAEVIWANRGNTPRLYRNTLAFLAADQTRLQDLEEAARRFLAWESILADRETLDLSPHQTRQAEAQRAAADSAVAARLPETYIWLLLPTQPDAHEPMQWQAFRLHGQDALAVRASKKLRTDDELITILAPTELRRQMDLVPLWRGDHVSIRQLMQDFASYLYLPRLQSPAVLAAAIADGLGLMLWHIESFAYADSYDEAAGRYLGLRCGQRVAVGADNPAGLLVRPEVAQRQQQAEAPDAPPAFTTGATPTEPGVGPSSGVMPPPVETTPPRPAAPRRYHGSVELDASRVGRDAGRIAEEVIVHLAGLPGARVKVTLEIEAELPSGAPENVVRIVTENGRTLRFDSQGFEEE